MKKTILLASAFFAMLFTTTVSAQVAAGDNGGGNKPSNVVSCCPKFSVTTPAATKGGKATTRLLVGNPFKGKNRGIDLTYDIMDSKGGAVAGWEGSISKNAAGDMTIDLGKLPKGKYRLRLKAGTATETYNF
jgi:hypothetical protein